MHWHVSGFAKLGVPDRKDALFEIDPALWLQETDLTEEFYRTFDGKIPPALYAELAALRYRLKAAQEA